jgi:hypothetical protein
MTKIEGVKKELTEQENLAKVCGVSLEDLNSKYSWIIKALDLGYYNRKYHNYHNYSISFNKENGVLSFLSQHRQNHSMGGVEISVTARVFKNGESIFSEHFPVRDGFDQYKDKPENDFNLLEIEVDDVGENAKISLSVKRSEIKKIINVSLDKEINIRNKNEKDENREIAVFMKMIQYSNRFTDPIKAKDFKQNKWLFKVIPRNDEVWSLVSIWFDSKSKCLIYIRRGYSGSYANREFNTEYFVYQNGELLKRGTREGNAINLMVDPVAKNKITFTTSGDYMNYAEVESHTINLKK